MDQAEEKALVRGLVRMDEGQRISGVVVDQDTHPVADAVVRLQGGENGDWDFFGATGQTTTDGAGTFELWITEGRFELDRLTPGLVTLSVEMDSVLFANVIGEPVELKPGQTRDLGAVTLKDNPMINVELGQVFLNPAEFDGIKNLPTVPYKVTLKDGTKLEGNLPFEYTFDGDAPHWHGLQGIDWHLNGAKQQ